MADNFIHHGPSARAHVPYSVLEFKRRSNYQQRNKWNFSPTLIYLFFPSHINKRSPPSPNLNIKTILYSNRSAVLLIRLMFSRSSQTTLYFTVNSAKFAILRFLSEPARGAGWEKHSEFAFFSDGLVSVPKSLSNVYTLKRNFEQNILPCTLFSWFPARLNIG